MNDYIKTINESIDALLKDVNDTGFLSEKQKQALIMLLNNIQEKTKEVKTTIDEYINYV